jgi:hypothetical protein
MSNYTLQVVPDIDPQNPRTEWSDATYMVCWHNNYKLGDAHNALPIAVPNPSDHGGWEELEAELRKRFRAQGDPVALILPLYLYDHSGITMRTTPFSCGWDSGQVGFVLVTQKQLRENWGVKRPSTKRKEQLYDYMRAEVQTYDDYLTGNVYGYEIRNDEDEVVESCWGFYGEKYCRQEGEAVLAQIERVGGVQLELDWESQTPLVCTAYQTTPVCTAYQTGNN